MAREYTNWTSNRGNSSTKLNNVLPITNTANGKRYYSSIDGELYFGDIFVDEVTDIAWSVQQQTLPIYGYNSHTFDDIAVGSRLIQGQFAINFTERNFIQKLQDNTEAFRSISRRMFADDNPTTTSFTDYRKRLHLPKWDKGFDIVIGFGADNGKLNTTVNKYNTFVVLDCVQVTGSTLQLNYGGEPVQEIYTFIARDIKETYLDTSSYSSDTSESSSTTNSSTASTTSSAAISGSINLSSSTKNIIITANNEISLKAGSIQFKDDFNNKTLKTVMTLKSNGDKEMYANWSTDFLNTFKKECGNKDSILGIVLYSYIDKGDNIVKTLEVTIDFTIKK